MIFSEKFHDAINVALDGNLNLFSGLKRNIVVHRP